MIRKAGLNLLRLLIGVGFTLSLVSGVTLTMLMLFDGNGNHLVLSRTGLHSDSVVGAAIAWALTLFWWICWRCLPAVKPMRLFPMLERLVQKPPSLFGSIIWTVITTACICFTLGLGLQLAAHAPGATWTQFIYWCFITVTNGQYAFSGWKQWRRKRQAELFKDKIYQQED